MGVAIACADVNGAACPEAGNGIARVAAGCHCPTVDSLWWAQPDRLKTLHADGPAVNPAAMRRSHGVAPEPDPSGGKDAGSAAGKHCRRICARGRSSLQAGRSSARAPSCPRPPPELAARRRGPSGFSDHPCKVRAPRQASELGLRIDSLPAGRKATGASHGLLNAARPL